jgi:hypothetical protein
MAEFLEDHIPGFVFIVKQNPVLQKIEFKILKLRKNVPVQVDG